MPVPRQRAFCPLVEHLRQMSLELAAVPEIVGLVRTTEPLRSLYLSAAGNKRRKDAESTEKEPNSVSSDTRFVGSRLYLIGYVMSGLNLSNFRHFCRDALSR